MNDIIFGIDLGTTNSEIALLRDGLPTVIPVDGEPVMPSCVGIDPDGRLVVGRTARNQMTSHPEKTVLSVKRRMGSKDRVPMAGREYSPEEISALILGKLKSAAEAFTGRAAGRAVITVPAYFDDAQRTATRDAGVLAGLEVVRIIHEPTAAALAYEAGHAENQKILVYDLGGGTFDASLVVVENGVVEVKSSHGDTRLGGDDFDRLLIDEVSEDFLAEKGTDPRLDPVAFHRLWSSVERAKRELSDKPFATLREEYLAGGRHLETEIRRSRYEELIEPLVRRTLVAVRACLADARLLPRDLDKVILVGGTTRTPLVQKILREELSADPRHEIEPELIVALGASIQAGSLAGEKTRAILVDITPHTFGTRAVSFKGGLLDEDHFSPIIRRNTPIPCRREEVYLTMVDDQEAVDVEVYEGEGASVLENTLVGRFTIGGLSPAPAGSPILLEMDLDVNGILHVTAREKATNLSRSARIDVRDRGRLIDLGEARRRLERLETGEDAGEGPVPGGAGAPDEGPAPPAGGEEALANSQALRRRAEKLLGSLSPDDAAEVQAKLDWMREAAAGGDWAALERCNESLSDVLFYLEG